MFNTFTWNEFLAVAVIGLAVYYLIVGITFFRREIKNRFTASAPPDTKPPKVNQEAPDLIGRIAPVQIPLTDLRTSLGPSEELSFADADETQNEVQPIESLPPEIAMGTVPDLLEEIKTLMNQVAELEVAPEELASVFEALLTRYPQLRGTPYQETVSVFIHEVSKDKLKAVLPLPLIRGWWN